MKPRTPTLRSHIPILHRLFALLAILALAGARSNADESQLPDGAEMSYLSNGEVKVGVDLHRGGAIVYLSRAGSPNLINNHDLGRQVQLSFFSGPVPFSVGDRHPSKHWEHIGWNPIQAGDDFHHGSPVLASRNDGISLYVRCTPMQWPLDNVPGECTYESWLELDGPVVKARGRLNNARSDTTPYPARLQELPAVYVNAACPRIVSYRGDHPFAGEAAVEVPKPAGTHPWSLWYGTENWAAALDAEDRGVGLITPGRIFFTGGFAGRPGPNDTHASSTAYLAGQGQEILDHDIVYEFRYELLPGSMAEIRARATAVHREGLPAWTFSADRQGWSYVHATDRGWPIQGYLEVPMELNDPQLMSPAVFWQAEDAPYVIIDAAFHTAHRAATLFWQRQGEAAPRAEDTLNFPIQADGEFHRYAVKLADAATYHGGMLRLRFDPVPAGKPGDWVKVRSVALSASP